MTQTVNIDGKDYLVKGPFLCPPDEGFHELMAVAREIEHNGKAHRYAVELKHEYPEMTAEEFARSVKPLFDCWEDDLLSGEGE